MMKRLIWLGPGVLTCACASEVPKSTDTGNPDNTPLCVEDVMAQSEVELRDITDFDARTSFGESVNEILETVAGKHQASFVWGEETQVLPNPEDERDEMTVTVTDHGQARYVQWPASENRLDFIEIPATIHLTLESGDAELEFDATLRAFESGLVRLGDRCRTDAAVVEAADATRAALTGLALDDDFDTKGTFQVNLGFLAGRFWGEVIVLDGLQGPSLAGIWPADSACAASSAPVEVDDERFGISVGAALAHAFPVSARLSWNDGSETTMNVKFVVDAPYACNDGVRQIDVAGRVEAASEDGRVSLSQKARFVAFSKDGARLDWFQVYAKLGSRDAPLSANALGQVWSREEALELAPGGGWVTFEYRTKSEDPSHTLGWIALYGLSSADGTCATPEDGPCDETGCQCGVVREGTFGL